ncbi:acyl-CoA dehydrogenase family protein [Oricola thermophila]|uniref:Acyl-CoA dehydrogenase family protein n=1 Tax=Oricola thermophila TaxID=2742145 RepID=A0A6N1VFR3_9HYPH|nr:acyl-CoA dehydrogenase family protein [Oricola thermophila]QKV17989.1 acyl-CoA dehydrogenase family protein [Oricola thermophila]
MSETHEVTNQTPQLAGNAFLDDPLLLQFASGAQDAQMREWQQIGAYVRSAEALDLARLANVEIPRLKTHDRQGRRIDRVEFHPAYHALMRRSAGWGLSGSVWEARNRGEVPGHQRRAISFYMVAGLETGHLCPMTMTNASIAALRTSPELAREWAPRIASRKYDSSHRAPAEKVGLTVGMGMTEKQGGTDVQANTTEARPEGRDIYRLTGHKWFMSAPMSDAFLVLAQAPKGLSCFLVPRLLADGEANGIRFMRLKDKLGNRSNASSEAEFHDSVAQIVGEEGEGVRTILEMVTLTRLDCAVASAGLMRAAMVEAVHHARHRSVFGAKLVDQPLMTRVLADMAVDTAAATVLSMRLAYAFDHQNDSELESAWVRAMTPVVKYWVCKVAPPMIGEAMECLGGNGYIEDFSLARHYREAPVNSIWEGSGNVMALDLLRVFRRSPELYDFVLQDISRHLGRRAAGTRDVLAAAFDLARSDPGAARIVIEQLALAAAASELYRIGAGGLADAFAETRLGGTWRSSYGMLDSRFDAAQLVEALYPPEN